MKITSLILLPALLVGMVVVWTNCATAQVVVERFHPRFGPAPFARAEITPFGKTLHTPFGTIHRPRYPRPVYRERHVYRGPVYHREVYPPRADRRRAVVRHHEHYVEPTRPANSHGPADPTAVASRPKQTGARTVRLAGAASPSESLSESATQLDRNLNQLKNGAGWQAYLRTKELISLVPEGQQSQLSDDQQNRLQSLLSLFDDTSGAPEFRPVTEVVGFRAVQSTLKEMLSEQRLAAPVVSADEAGSDKEISVLTKSPRKTAEELPTPRTARGE